MATHSSVLAWRIPGMGEPGGLPSTGLQSDTTESTQQQQQRQQQQTSVEKGTANVVEIARELEAGPEDD